MEAALDITDLGNGFARITTTGLDVLDATPDLSQFLSARDAIIDRGQSADWAIADLFILGERLFGEDVWQFVDDLKMMRKTVQNKVWIGRKFPVRPRRRPELTMSHHGAVAVLIGNEDHPEWEALAYEKLDRAIRDNLSVEDLEEEVRLLQGRENKPPEPPSVTELITASYDSATKALKELDGTPMEDVRALVQTAADSLADALDVLA